MFAQREGTTTPTTGAATAPATETKPEFYRNEPSPTPSAGSQPDRLSGLQFQEHPSPYATAAGSSFAPTSGSEYIDNPEPYFPKPYPQHQQQQQQPQQQHQGFHSPPSSFPDQKDAVFSPGFSSSMFSDPRPPFQTYQSGIFDSAGTGNFVQGAMYRGDFNIHIGRQPYTRNLSLSIGNPLGPDM